MSNHYGTHSTAESSPGGFTPDDDISDLRGRMLFSSQHVTDPQQWLAILKKAGAGLGIITSDAKGFYLQPNEILISGAGYQREDALKDFNAKCEAMAKRVDMSINEIQQSVSGARPVLSSMSAAPVMEQAPNHNGGFEIDDLDM